METNKKIKSSNKTLLTILKEAISLISYLKLIIFKKFDENEEIEQMLLEFNEYYKSSNITMNSLEKNDKEKIPVYDIYIINKINEYKEEAKNLFLLVTDKIEKDIYDKHESIFDEFDNYTILNSIPSELLKYISKYLSIKEIGLFGVSYPVQKNEIKEMKNKIKYISTFITNTLINSPLDDEATPNYYISRNLELYGFFSFDSKLNIYYPILISKRSYPNMYEEYGNFSLSLTSKLSLFGAFEPLKLIVKNTWNVIKIILTSSYKYVINISKNNGINEDDFNKQKEDIFTLIKTNNNPNVLEFRQLFDFSKKIKKFDINVNGFDKYNELIFQLIIKIENVFYFTDTKLESDNSFYSKKLATTYPSDLFKCDFNYIYNFYNDITVARRDKILKIQYHFSLNINLLIRNLIITKHETTGNLEYLLFNNKQYNDCLRWFDQDMVEYIESNYTKNNSWPIVPIKGLFGRISILSSDEIKLLQKILLITPTNKINILQEFQLIINFVLKTKTDIQALNDKIRLNIKSSIIRNTDNTFSTFAIPYKKMEYNNLLNKIEEMFKQKIL